MRASLLFLAMTVLAAAGPVPPSQLSHKHNHLQRYVLKRDTSSEASSTDSSSATSSATSSAASSTASSSAESSTQSSSAESSTQSSSAESSAESSSDISTSYTSATSETSAASSSDILDSDSSSDLPSATTSSSEASDSSNTMPAATTTASSLTAASSSVSYSYTAEVPEASGTGVVRNPYIQGSLAPTNVVFISVGAVIGALLVAVVAVRVLQMCISRRKALTDKEVYFLNTSLFSSWGGSSGGGSTAFGSSSLSSILEKSLTSSTMLQKYPTSNSLNWDTSAQGRTYRDMHNKQDNRLSMAVSPIFQMMQSLRSQIDLPLLHPNTDFSHMAHSASSTQGSTEVADKGSSRPRPPSQYLDDLLDGIDFDTYPENNGH